MFTGIVEELGEVADIAEVTEVPEATRVRIRGQRVTADARHGDSIAVNGVCLTVTELDGETFAVDAVAETLRTSSLGSLRAGGRVNLERATAVGDRLGGHIVQGHVDGVGTFLRRDPDGTSSFAVPPELNRFLVSKGSIAVNGVSLTVVDVTAEEFTVALIPTTLRETTLGELEPGDAVNLETDVLAKYLDKLAQPHLTGAAGGQ